MSTFKKHCDDCIKVLGNPHERVHIWLDAWYNVYKLHHRIIRHHDAAVEKIRKEWGEESAKAAEIHIQEDCEGVPKLEEARWQGYLRVAYGSNAVEQLNREFPETPPIQASTDI